MKGICFDAEPYAKPFAQFRYNGQPNRHEHSFDEYHVKARQRGREVIRNSEEYVWGYGEAGRWWPDPGDLKPWPTRKVFPSWEEVIPGSTQALADEGVYLQQVLVEPGKTYHVAAWWKKSGRGEPKLSIRWKRPDGQWISWMQREPQLDKVVLAEDAVVEGKWCELAVQVAVPEEAGQICIHLGAHGQSTPEDVIWYDDVEVFQHD